MQPEAQWFLVESLAAARAQRESLSDDVAKRSRLSYHRGVLRGFGYLGALTSEEESLWGAKMVDALGLAAQRAVGIHMDRDTAVTQATVPTRSGPPVPIRGWAPPPRAASRPSFLRYVTGPTGEFELFGGLLRIIALEIYDTLTVVRWAMAQEPDLSMVFPDEAAALEADVADLEEWAADELRKKAKQRLRMQRLFTFRLSDDVSTEYLPSGSGWRSGPEGATGEATFLPTIPPQAKTLTLEWFDLAINIPLLPAD